MKKNKVPKLDNIDRDLVSVDETKSNESIINNNINNRYSINNTDNGPKPSIRKTKTAKVNSPKREKKSKKNKSPNRTHKNPKNSDKKVKFKEKVDIVKVECWKQYNLEQTADECEFIDDILEDFEIDNNDKGNNKDKDKNDKKNDKNDKNNKNDKKNEKPAGGRNRTNNNKKGKGKKGNYTCTCIII